MSALTTGHAGVLGHLLEVGLGVGAPHDRPRPGGRAPGRRRATDSRTPMPASAAVDEHRVAAELGDAGGEGRLGAQRRLVEDHRDRPRAGERLGVVRRRLELERRGRGPAPARPGVRSSSARKCRSASSPIASSRMRRPGGQERVGVVVGEHQRRREPDPVGRGVVDDEAGLPARRRRPRRTTSAARSRPISRPSPRTSVTRGSAARPSRSFWPSTVTCSSRPVVLDGADHGERGGAGDRVAAERGAVVAGLEQLAGGADADAGADREAAAEALGHA